MPGASQSFADARNPETMIAMVLRPEVAALTRKDHPAASGDVTRLVGSGRRAQAKRLMKSIVQIVRFRKGQKQNNEARRN